MTHYCITYKKYIETKSISKFFVYAETKQKAYERFKNITGIRKVDVVLIHEVRT